MTGGLRGRPTGPAGVPSGWCGPLPDLSVRRRLPVLDGYVAVPSELATGGFPDLGVLVWSLVRLSFDDRPGRTCYQELAEVLGLEPASAGAVEQRFRAALKPLLGTWLVRGDRDDDNVYRYRAVVPEGAGKRYAMLRRADFELLRTERDAGAGPRLRVADLADFTRWQLECGQRGWTASSTAAIAAAWQVSVATVRRSRSALVAAHLLEVTSREGRQIADIVWLKELFDPHWAVPSPPMHQDSSARRPLIGAANERSHPSEQDVSRRQKAGVARDKTQGLSATKSRGPIRELTGSALPDDLAGSSAGTSVPTVEQVVGTDARDRPASLGVDQQPAPKAAEPPAGQNPQPRATERPSTSEADQISARDALAQATRIVASIGWLRSAPETVRFQARSLIAGKLRRARHGVNVEQLGAALRERVDPGEARGQECRTVRAVLAGLYADARAVVHDDVLATIQPSAVPELVEACGEALRSAPGLLQQWRSAPLPAEPVWADVDDAAAEQWLLRFFAHAVAGPHRLPRPALLAQVRRRLPERFHDAAAAAAATVDLLASARPVAQPSQRRQVAGLSALPLLVSLLESPVGPEPDWSDPHAVDVDGWVTRALVHEVSAGFDEDDGSTPGPARPSPGAVLLEAAARLRGRIEHAGHREAFEAALRFLSTAYDPAGQYGQAQAQAS